MPRPRHGCSARRLAALLAGALAVATPTVAAADEPWLFSLEAGAMVPLTAPQTDLFRPGVAGAAALHRPLAPWLLWGVRVRGGVLFDGAPPDDAGREDPGVGGLGTLTLTGRIRPLAPLAGRDDARRATGLFVDAGGGAAITGGALRGTVEGGLGWGFELGAFALAPVVRYVWVHQPQGQGVDDRDAHLLLAGLELVWNDARDTAPAVPPPPSDRDLDGIPDDADACPDVPEDHDGFEDDDGCPEEDNDGDGLPDARDTCPNEPEDFDGFRDGDGCPDPDNDQDGLLDPVDQCPDEAEIVNGVEDGDGCPDEGLIQMVDDRIVLEERVLFDFERSRVKLRARPVIEAIVELYRQHPEWAEMRVEGHADVRGEATFNQDLSERRAENVVEALVRAGMAADAVRAEGFGATRPRDLRDTEQAHQRNRRVEFVVIRRHGEETTEETITPPPVRAETPEDAPAAAEDLPAHVPSPAVAAPPPDTRAEEAP